MAEGFDLALRIADLADSSLRVRRLMPIRRLTVAAPAYLERRGRPLHPSDLNTHACFGYAYLPTPDIWTFVSDVGEVVSVRPDGPLRVNNGDAVIPALAAGLGIAVVPEFLLGDILKRGRLEQILPGWNRRPISLYLVAPPGSLQPVRIRVLADYLAHGLTKRGDA